MSDAPSGPPIAAQVEQLIQPLRQDVFAAQQRWVHAIELAGRQASWQLAQRQRITTLADAEFRIFSQWGEDGIIEWLIQQLPIEHQTFIEFGVGDYHEANTRFLLTNRNWRGLVLDRNPNLMQIANAPWYWRQDLTFGIELIMADTIDAVFAKYGFQGDIGLLSVDIDGIDLWVLEKITSVSPAILICEYNAILGDLHPITVPYDPTFSINKYDGSMLYFGASIAAMRLVLERKGYVFVGTNSHGVNAFFVRGDLAPHLDGKLEQRVAYPALHRCCFDAQGRLATRSGLARLDLIGHLPVLNLATNETVTIESLGNLYSPAWLKRVGHRFPMAPAGR